MNTTDKLVLAATPTAYAGSNRNGPQLTGIALRSLEAYRPVVTAVRLPSGNDGAFATDASLRGPGPDAAGPKGGFTLAANGAKPDPSPPRGEPPPPAAPHRRAMPACHNGGTLSRHREETRQHLSRAAGRSAPRS
jgi:hypothetical protein